MIQQLNSFNVTGFISVNSTDIHQYFSYHIKRHIDNFSFNGQQKVGPNFSFDVIRHSERKSTHGQGFKNISVYIIKGLCAKFHFLKMLMSASVRSQQIRNSNVIRLLAIFQFHV